MQSIKDVILEVLNGNTKLRLTFDSDVDKCIPEAEFDRVADEILSDLQANNYLQPQLKQTHVLSSTAIELPSLSSSEFAQRLKEAGWADEDIKAELQRTEDGDYDEDADWL